MGMIYKYNLQINIIVTREVASVRQSAEIVYPPFDPVPSEDGPPAFNSLQEENDNDEE